VVWGLLQEGGEETPWITAGLAGSIVLSGAAVLREVVFRRARNKILETQRQLDLNLRQITAASERSDKLTLEQNKAILREIRQKSDAARVLGSMPSGHREVLELCENYLVVNGRELAKVGPGSPRLASLLKGKELADDLHRYHMLRWAEVEARALSSEAGGKTKAAEKVKIAERALSAVELASKHYPDEPSLTASAAALNEFIAVTKVADWVERAERAVFRGNYNQAKKLYNDALFFIGRNSLPLDGRDLVADRINEELKKINVLEG
jgi:hypothetical protein